MNTDSQKSAQPSREDLAWAAGLFEGEGCFSTRRTGRPDRSLTAAIKSIDPDTLPRFQKIVRVGNVTGPHRYKRKKPVWYWQVGSFEGVQHVMASLWAWLSARRRARVIELLTLYHERGAA